MPLLKRVLAGLVAVSFCGFAVAQTTPVRGKVAPAAVPQAMSDCATQQGSSPCIDKIDPPNWWSNMPGPMLLLHGDHFNSAHFFVRGQNVAITRTRVSTNGHWAFLWLDTKNAAPQMLTVEATSSSGHTKENFELKQRKPASAGFKGFSPNDVIYLIMTDRFADGDPSNDNIGGNDGGRAAPRGWHGGDFKGIEDHLDYLQQLGVTTLWLTPITSNAGMKDSYHGYGATDLYATDPHFGSVQDYQHLVEALHGRGMKIVMDTVPNHVGIAIPWVNDPPAPDWFHGTLAQHSIAKSPFRYLADPHAAPLNKADITEGWFTDSLPDLNQENPLVAKYLIQNTIWWIETAGIDGLREDTFPYVGRRFWSEFHQQIHELYPRMTEVGEVYTPDPTIASYFAGGRKHNEVDTGLSTPFDYPLQFTLRAALTQDKPMTAIEETLGNDWLYPHPESLVTFFGNHDLKRFLSEPGASIAKLKVAFGLIATLRGTPEIYSGDEIAMQGGNDPDNRRDFPGGFPGDKTSAFTPAGRTPEQQQVYAWMQDLLHLRAKEPALTQGEQQNIFADDTAFAFVRGTNLSTGCASGNKRLLVIAGKNADARYLSVTTTQTSLEGCAHYVRLYPAEQIPVHTTRSTVSLDLPASGFVIYRATP